LGGRVIRAGGGKYIVVKRVQFPARKRKQRRDSEKPVQWEKGVVEGKNFRTRGLGGAGWV